MKDTAGNEDLRVDFCPHCQLDTAGTHEYDCPISGKTVIVVNEQ